MKQWNDTEGKKAYERLRNELSDLYNMDVDNIPDLDKHNDTCDKFNDALKILLDAHYKEV